MYAQKNAGRTSASRQSKDVLLRALAERNPDLRRPPRARSPTSPRRPRAARPRRTTRSEHVRHAAELHDVGKVAVPDAILAKPGPLDESEWAFIRRHTHHRRADQSPPPGAEPGGDARARQPRALGRRRLPRRLAGEAIPLGARIVAVADAFDAMTPPARTHPAHAARGARRAAPLRRRAVRSRRGRRVLRGLGERARPRAAA
jgi:hypothetical protein